MGEMLYTCTVCQYTKTELIPMLPATQKPSSTPTTPKPSTSSPHVEIGCGAVIALVLLAVAMTMIEKKKKH